MRLAALSLRSWNPYTTGKRSNSLIRILTPPPLCPRCGWLPSRRRLYYSSVSLPPPLPQMRLAALASQIILLIRILTPPPAPQMRLAALASQISAADSIVTLQAALQVRAADRKRTTRGHYNHPSMLFIYLHTHTHTYMYIHIYIYIYRYRYRYRCIDI